MLLFEKPAIRRSVLSTVVVLMAQLSACGGGGGSNLLNLSGQADSVTPSTNPVVSTNY